jgi:hypothetical protein
MMDAIGVFSFGCDEDDSLEAKFLDGGQKSVVEDAGRPGPSNHHGAGLLSMTFH